MGPVKKLNCLNVEILSWKKKKKFKTDLITSFILLLITS